MKSPDHRRSRRQFLRRLGLGGASLALPLGLIGCAENAAIVEPGEQGEPPLPPPGAPPEIRLSKPDGIALDQYDVADQRVTVVTSAGAMADPWVQFASSDESVAIVSPRGVVFGLRPGSARITVTAEGASRQFDVVVHEPLVIRNTPAASDIVVQDFTSEAINAALLAAAARGPGSVVFLPAGSYAVTSTIAIPASDLVLRGAGRRATWLVMTPELARERSIPTLRIQSVDRVSIEEVGFRYAADDQGGEYGDSMQVGIFGSTGSRVHRCAFEARGNAFWHVFIGMGSGENQPSFRTGVTECQGDGSKGHGVEINNSDECFVERCVITRSAMNSVEPYHRYGPFLRDNRIRDNVLIDPDVACVSVHTDVGTEISGNVMRGGGLNGVVLYFGVAGPTNPSRNGRCELNDIRGSGRRIAGNSSGIMASDGTGWIFRRNVVTDNRCYGILLGGSAHTLSDTLCRNNGRHGLYVLGTGHRIHANDFSDNTADPAMGSRLPAVYSEGIDTEFRGNRTEDTRAEKRHLEHYHILGDRVRFIENRGSAATTIAGIAALIQASNAVVIGNEDVPDSGA